MRSSPACRETYDAVCEKELMPLARLDKDPVRAEIDAALSAAMGLPDLKPLRQLLAREPGLTGRACPKNRGRLICLLRNPKQMQKCSCA
ncbi:MAG: hypothetical protein R2941_05300 [Desulfobacterales bacterium]